MFALLAIKAYGLDEMNLRSSREMSVWMQSSLVNRFPRNPHTLTR